jgi:prenyltransferase beta subunit
MKFWVRLSKSIFKLAALPLLIKIRPKSIESVLKKSINLLNDEMVDEIRSFIREKLTPQGGFADRAGKSDLYYSLFGYYIAEAFSVTDAIDPLKNFIKKKVTESNLSGVNLYCSAILYAKLHGTDDLTQKLGRRITEELKNSQAKQAEYSNFMGFLALYYLDDFLALKRLISQYKSNVLRKELPCPVTAANTILLSLAGRNDRSGENRLKSFYRGNGGFAAVSHAPFEDLLSTGVALYALNFIDADTRLMKPDCLSFIDGLYENGGFRSTQSDFETDVEYTFYGLLALGSLN